MTTDSSAALTWAARPLLPSLKRCEVCREDVQGARLAVTPERPDQPEAMIVRCCGNCGHLTVMGPWLLKNGEPR